MQSTFRRFYLVFHNYIELLKVSGLKGLEIEVHPQPLPGEGRLKVECSIINNLITSQPYNLTTSQPHNTITQEHSNCFIGVKVLFHLGLIIVLPHAIGFIGDKVINLSADRLLTFQL